MVHNYLEENATYTKSLLSSSYLGYCDSASCLKLNGLILFLKFVGEQK